MLELNQCYNMDCMKGMAQFPDGFFDLAVVDPPYFSGPERRGYYGSKVSKIGVHRDYPVSPVWEIPGRAYFDELHRVAKHMYGNAGELIFYDSALIAPIADVVKNSDYIQTVVRKTAGGAPYVVIKDGFEVLAGFVPLKIITKQFLEDLSEFESACVSQYMREQERALDEADPDKQDEDAEQIGMEDAESENE